MPDGAQAWRLEKFLERLDAWVARECPPADLVLLVTAWIMSRHVDPYAGVRREPNFDNLWWGAVPNTEDGRGRIVVCSYWIVERTRTVQCDNFATLSLPL